MQGKSLILGATGAFGCSVAHALMKKGTAVRVLVRNFDKARRLFGENELMEILPGDPLDMKEVTAAAEGCSWVVHGIGFPLFRWAEMSERAMEAAIAGARSAGAAVMFPGNVYPLGRQVGVPMTEGAAIKPCTVKGEVRARLLGMLMKASMQGHLRAVVLRAGDYFGPMARNWSVDRIFGNAAAGRMPMALGNIEIQHQWAFVPDVGRAAVDLMEGNAEMLPFEIVHFPGYIAKPQRIFLGMVAEQAGLPARKVGMLPWWRVRLAGMLDPVAREIREMRYLYDEAVVLDGTKFRAIVPGFVDTPLLDAIRMTLDDYRRNRALVPAALYAKEGA